MKIGSEGYPEEQDFTTLAHIASVPFEITIESAPNMQPLKYGDGDPRARFILKEISDGAGHRTTHWDEAALYDRSTKRRRITGNGNRLCTTRSLDEVRPGPGRGPGVFFF